MSTNNQPKQTLFRMVSLRAPQKSDEQGQDKRFVLAPETLKTSDGFYKHIIVNSGTKQELLAEYAAIFENSTNRISSKGELDSLFAIKDFKNAYQVLYDFSKWVARNKNSCSYEEFVSQRDLVNASHNYVAPDKILLWNNLIYQVITLKDFEAKEVVMQMLLALHIIENSSATEEEARVLLNARIVLPKDLMMDDDAVTSGSQQTARPGVTPFYATEEMQKQQKVASANMTLSRLETLEKELTKVQKKYNKEYQAAYKVQEEAYQQEIVRPIMDQYNADVIAAQSAYCETRDPNVEYNPEDPCNQPVEVPAPEVPKFEVDFRDEVEATQMISALGENSLETLLNLLEYEVPMDFNAQEVSEEQLAEIQSVMEDTTTFQELSELISTSREAAQKQILDNTISSERTFKSVGGVMIPVARAATISNYFTICPKQVARWTSFDLVLHLPDSTWDVAGVSYTLTETVNNVAYPTSDYYVKTKVNNTIYLNDLMASVTSDGQLLLDLPYSLNIQVTFTNGQTTQIVANFESLKYCDRGNFEIDGLEQGGNGEEGNFTPSGFGFKNIGIADYLKVEQSTHAYVPGEVAHIENIMAREYRQKSTRRLRRSENTSTTSSDTEREKLTDTTTATRFEMQSEIAKMQAEATDKSAFVNFGARWGAGEKTGIFNLNTGANYANHKSKEESTRQAMTQSQDITERALDRIVSKVHEERIEKVIEEFEENNAHGFDNREGDKNVVGVFRWVDKLMKNQIYNYGKRMMFEFMIPEPAKLHDLGMEVQKSAADIELKEPEDPRKVNTPMKMKDYSSLENEVILKHWASRYNVDIDEKPSESINVSYSFSDKNQGIDEDGTGRWTGVYSNDFDIPELYEAIFVKGTLNVGNGTYKHGIHPVSHVYICGKESSTNVNMSLDSVRNKISVSSVTWDIKGISGSLVASCQLTKEAKNAWLQKTFNAIIDAYENALVEFNNKVSEQQSKAVEIKGSNPAFYRQIENTVLRKNCISYMIDRTANSTHGYGMSGLTQGSTFADYETVLSPTLDKYTAFVKFIEQAFEWENLSYYLYPYYWGDKKNWSDLYQSEDIDPLFRAFIQSGMARVIVTVRPGFEDAVQFYMATGKIWNGGEVPVIGEDLYMSIVDEMKEPKGEKQGDAWITRLPTPLTILQAQNARLVVEHALPFTEENPEEFENPEELVTESPFDIMESQLGVRPDSSASKLIEGDWN